MREWHLKSGDPLSLTIAADARLCTPSYTDDQIWELGLGKGEPPALALQTTYGLRARNMRLFPRFIEGDRTCTDPSEFFSLPVVRQFYPNFLLVTFSPFPEVDVSAEYWVPSSQAVAGRMRILNQGSTARQIRMDWVALLTPTEDGERMAPCEMQAVQVLCGQSGKLSPVVFLTGGPIAAAGSYPALSLELDLPAGGHRLVIWSHAALSTHEESFQLARRIAAHNWEAERGRIEMLNAGQIEVHTGNADWDAAFALAQKVAFSLFLGPTAQLPERSFVNARCPDHGYSRRGDGSDYGHLWNGQSPLESYALSELILPAAPQLARGLLRNFLSTQQDTGFVDWRPGLGGQRSKQLATPLLASLAWRIYQATEDRAFLEEIYPRLLAYLYTWFEAEHDRDGDGIPEWDHPMQTGFDDHPFFARWYEWSQGVDTTMIEGPSLCAFLYYECQAMIHIAELLKHTEPLSALSTLADNLHTAVETCWDENTATYRYWDRDTHLSPPGMSLGERTGSGEIRVQQTLELPARLLVRIHTSGASPRQPQVYVHGTSPSGAHRLEHVPSSRFQWFLGLSTVTSERVYAAVEYIDVQGLGDDDRVTLSTVDFTSQNQTLLLPLWAGIPTDERAAALIAHNLTDTQHYWKPFGLLPCPTAHHSIDNSTDDIRWHVDILWNTLIGKGLIRYGRRAEAADLVTNLMEAVIRTLKYEGSFRRYYHAETGQGSGERDSLGGLAPMGLFLEVIGVQLISPYRLIVTGFNPFPWPITVKYRGLTILCRKDKTMVIFPDGQTVSVSQPVPCIVALE